MVTALPGASELGAVGGADSTSTAIVPTRASALENAAGARTKLTVGLESPGARADGGGGNGASTRHPTPRQQASQQDPEAPGKRAAEIGFDWFNLFVANIQTGFGPFIAVYLTTQAWTQTEIGVALSVGTVTSLLSQIPAGALVDSLRNKTLVAVLSVVAFTASALLLAAHPIPLFVYLAEILHGFSSCTLGPAIAAISLALAGSLSLGTRLGRNARFGSIGNGVGAALMGACGYYISDRAVFFLTALLTLPALFALVPVRRFGMMAPTGDRDSSAMIDPQAPLSGSSDPEVVEVRSTGAAQTQPEPGKAHSQLSAIKPPQPGEPKSSESKQARPSALRWSTLVPVLRDRRLLIFSACALIFTFANTPLLPLTSVALTTQVSAGASLYIAACIVVPQVIVALISPKIGRLAETRGRRAILLLGFLALPVRAVLLAFVHTPALIVAIQALDGISAACFGISVPLVTSDVAGRSGHYTLVLGIIGFAMGVGATVSTSFAGWGADRFGQRPVFLELAGFALLAPLLVRFALPETRPERAAPR